MLIFYKLYHYKSKIECSPSFLFCCNTFFLFVGLPYLKLMFSIMFSLFLIILHIQRYKGKCQYIVDYN